MTLTVVQIADRIWTEADAWRFMEELRWGTAEPTCSHCGNVGASFVQPTNGESRKTRNWPSSYAKSNAKHFSAGEKR